MNTILLAALLAAAPLKDQVDAARKADPAAFDALARVRADLPMLDAQKRGGQPIVSPALRDLGPRALFPLIHEAMFAPPPDVAREAWQLAVLEVLGELRAPVAAPVFRAVLDGPDGDFALNQIAAGALGQLGDPSPLVTFSAGPKRRAVLAGMGTCRRVAIAQTLAAAVSTTSDARGLIDLAKSLGAVGNSWAWRTPGLPAPSEEAAVREIAARALVQAFVKGDPQARQAASNALMVVDAPQTQALVQEAKRIATGPTLTALTGLERRFARNPVTTR